MRSRSSWIAPISAATVGFKTDSTGVAELTWARAKAVESQKVHFVMSIDNKEWNLFVPASSSPLLQWQCNGSDFLNCLCWIVQWIFQLILSRLQSLAIAHIDIKWFHCLRIEMNAKKNHSIPPSVSVLAP
jgi:hypothetical protein